jgi:hypothetical protein
MKNICIILLIFSLIAGGCIVPVNTLQTVPLRENDTTSLHGFVYSLPRTTIKIEAEIVMTRTIRGPFYRFAERYMGIENAPQQSSIAWDLAVVRMETFTEPDPESYYLVRTVSGKPDMTDFARLSAEGLVLDIRLPQNQPALGYTSRGSMDPMAYKDISIHPNVLYSSDTLYKTMLTDSSFIKVPVLRDQLIERTIDEKAMEAADLIYKLRKRRFHMISANYDFMPQGVAMEHALKELDRLEEEYLSLFIGKQYTEKETLTFYFTPDPGMDPQQVDLFEFSRNDGVVSRSTPDSEKVSLTITQEGRTAILKGDARNAQYSRVTNAFYYRIPDTGRVNLFYGNKSLIQDRVPVYQYGAVLSMPVSVED